MAIQIPSNVMVEIMRAWISPATEAAPADEIMEFNFFRNTNTATGGTIITPVEVQGNADAGSAITAFRQNPAAGASPTNYHYDAFHVQSGMLWTPLPEEMDWIVAPNDNWGIAVPAVPDITTMNFSAGVRWAEYS